MNPYISNCSQNIICIQTHSLHLKIDSETSPPDRKCEKVYPQFVKGCWHLTTDAGVPGCFVLFIC
jgi:hypothetical protein